MSLDADETVLNNSEYQKGLAEMGAGFDPATWNAWVRREAAPAIPGAAPGQEGSQLAGEAPRSFGNPVGATVESPLPDPPPR